MADTAGDGHAAATGSAGSTGAMANGSEAAGGGAPGGISAGEGLAAVLEANAALVQGMDKLQRENQQLRRLLRVMESKMTGGFTSMGKRLGGMYSVVLHLVHSLTRLVLVVACCHIHQAWKHH